MCAAKCAMFLNILSSVRRQCKPSLRRLQPIRRNRELKECSAAMRNGKTPAAGRFSHALKPLKMQKEGPRGGNYVGKSGKTKDRR